MTVVEDSVTSEGDKLAKTVSDVMKSYGVSREFGFLLERPLQRLPDKYRPWQDICDNIPTLIHQHQLTTRLQSLPLLSTADLVSLEELHLAHIYLTTMASGYIWQDGPDRAPNVLPKAIAIPYYEVSQRLGMKPVFCHATGCLSNWKLIDESKPFQAENLDLVSFNLLGTQGNVWFFTNTAQIEYDLAPAIEKIAHVCYEAKSQKLSIASFEELLKTLIQCLAAAREALTHMKDHLTPAEFYHDLRTYLWGYNRGCLVESGVTFEGLEHLGAFKCSGGSAAQSSALQVIDAALGIKHEGSDAAFLIEQRDYMPERHRLFIDWVLRNSPVAMIRCSESYEKAIQALREFRSEHIRMVARFILTQVQSEDEKQGTGGSPFMTFLKNVRDDVVSKPASLEDDD